MTFTITKWYRKHHENITYSYQNFNAISSKIDRNLRIAKIFHSGIIISSIHLNTTFIITTTNFLLITADVFGSLLCGYQPLQEIPCVHVPMRQAVQRQASFGSATPHFRHFRRRLRQHVDQPRKSIYVDYVSVPMIYISPIYILVKNYSSKSNIS